MDTLTTILAWAFVAHLWLGFALFVFAIVFEFVLWLRGDHDYRYDATVCPDAGGERQSPR